MHDNIDGHVVDSVDKGVDLCPVRDRERETSTRDELDKSLVIGFLVNSGLEMLLLLYITTFFTCLLLAKEALNRALNYNLLL